MILDFTGPMWYWRGPAPHYFISVPEEQVDALKAISKRVTYGWGMIPVQVQIGKSSWKTSLWPKDGRYIVPIRANIRQKEHLEEGAEIAVTLSVDVH